MSNGDVYYKLQYKAGDNWLTVAQSDDLNSIRNHRTQARLIGKSRIVKIARAWIPLW